MVAVDVAFTGCDDLERARLEGRAQAAGLRVTGAVSRKTAVLDGMDPHTTKATAAREFVTRTIKPAVFAEMVAYVQPPTSPANITGAVATKTRPATSVTGTATLEATASLADVHPAAIRDWARQQGVPVGVRGRLPTELVAAYRAAHTGSLTN